MLFIKQNCFEIGHQHYSSVLVNAILHNAIRNSRGRMGDHPVENVQDWEIQQVTAAQLPSPGGQHIFISVTIQKDLHRSAHIINKNILHADLPHNAWEKQTHSFRCKRPTVLLIFNLLICREQTGHLELNSISKEVYVNITCFLTFCRKVTHDYDCMCSKTQSVSTLIHGENYLKCYLLITSFKMITTRKKSNPKFFKSRNLYQGLPLTPELYCIKMFALTTLW